MGSLDCYTAPRHDSMGPEGEIANAFDVERGRGDATARTTFVIVDGAVHTVYETFDRTDTPARS